MASRYLVWWKTWKSCLAASVTSVCLAGCNTGHDRAGDNQQRSTPVLAHAISDGLPVAGSPEPEVVQLERIEQLDGMTRVTVGNVAGDYILTCRPGANKGHGIPSCLSPRPQRYYLLFRAKTRWQIKGAKEPMNLAFMQEFSVSYNDHENIGLLPAMDSADEEGEFGVYSLLSWVSADSKTVKGELSVSP